jgi:hypothetical protein
MKRVIIDIPDEYAGAVSVTAIGVGQIGMRSEAHIKTTVVVLEGECTEIKLEAEERGCLVQIIYRLEITW